MDDANMATLWKAVLADAELSGGFGPLYDTFWKPTKLISVKDNVYTIEVNNFFAKSQFEQKYQQDVIKFLQNQNIEKPRLVFVTSKHLSTKHEQADTVVIEETEPEKKSATATDSFPTKLNTKYQFDNFIVGSCNELAYTAAKAAAENPGTKYNPIFIYGGPGVGKTHLIQAIGNYIISKSPDKKVRYATTEEFTNDYIFHIGRKTAQEFTDKYRNLDVLIIDDIQFIRGKDKTQEAFFNTFNSLHQANKQIIISSDRPPSTIPTLTERLKSRFQMGMTIDINLPDYETRMGIIKTKAQLISDIDLPEETAQYIAENVKTNVRELEGILNQVLAYAEMRDVPPTPEFANAILNANRPSRTKHITPRQIIEKTCKYFGIKSVEIKSSARNSRIAYPRQVAMFLLRSELHMSYPCIARELGRSDHTTAMHSISKIEQQQQLNAEVRDSINKIKDSLYV